MPSLDQTARLLTTLGEPTRVRLLKLLNEGELSVADLTAITDLPQSRVSTHLARLRDAGLVRDRRVGTSTLYAAHSEGIAQELWTSVASSVEDDVLASDQVRRAARLRAKGGFPEALAGEMERHYSPGRTWESMLHGLVGLLELGDVLDVGAGDGAVAAILAPRARSWLCLDASDKMVAAAKKRLGDRAVCRVGDAGALPADDASFDTVLLFHVLVHLPYPGRALAEAARVLRPGGVVAILSLDEHSHADLAAAYGHLHQGLSSGTLRRQLTKAGLDVTDCRVTSRERREPHLQVVSAFARKESSR
jgi:DNA-binding transcriptional ArsR family regulator